MDCKTCLAHGIKTEAYATVDAQDAIMRGFGWTEEEASKAGWDHAMPMCWECIKQLPIRPVVARGDAE